MKVIIFTNGLGGVSICYPTGELPIEAVKAKDTPEGSLIVNHDDLPNADADFFDAWELSGETVSVNFAKAQAITKARLRAERAPLLEAQDILFMKNLEAGKDNSAVVAEKQRLRDITKLADTAATLDELRGLSCQ